MTAVDREREYTLSPLGRLRMMGSQLAGRFATVALPAHFGNSRARSNLELEAERERLNEPAFEPKLDRYFQASTDPHPNSAAVQEAACSG